MHVLYNVSTAFLAFIVSSIHRDILNTPLSKSLVTLGGLVLKLLLLAKDSAWFCFHGFSKTTCPIAMKLYTRHRQSLWACLIENNFDLEQWPWPGGYYLSLSYFGTYLSNRSAKYHQTLTQNSSYSWLSARRYQNTSIDNVYAQTPAAITWRIVVGRNFVTRDHRKMIPCSRYRFLWARNLIVSLVLFYVHYEAICQ